MCIRDRLVDAYKTYDNGTKALNGVNLERCV